MDSITCPICKTQFVFFKNLGIHLIIDQDIPDDVIRFISGKHVADLKVSDLLTKQPITPDQLKPGEPCDHPGCLQHRTHPCEGCGRIAGR